MRAAGAIRGLPREERKTEGGRSGGNAEALAKVHIELITHARTHE
jgi:hypothetical protein